MLFGAIRHKIWYDLWENKGRTLRVVAVIAVGAFAVGVVMGAKEFMLKDIARTWQESNPSTIGLEVKPPVSEQTLQTLEHLPEIEQVEGWQQRRVQWRPSPDQPWQTAFLVAIDDYEAQTLRRIKLDDGAWPERKLIGVQRGRDLMVGDQVQLEIGDKIHTTKINGVLYNPAHPPPLVFPESMFYTTQERFTELTGEARSSLVLATIPNYSKSRVEAAADAMQRELERQGVEVEGAIPTPGGFKTRTNHPKRFIVQDALDGVFLMLTVMAVATLLLGLLLVYNTINAVILQQISQIGVMKAIGASFGQILLIYFSTVFVYGVLALLVAVPLGALGAHGLRVGLLGSRIMMIPGPFEISTYVVTVQATITLLAPLLVALIPIFSGARITVREAISTYGLDGASSWLERWLSKAKNMPRILSLTLGNTFRNKKRVALTQLTLVGAGIIFMMVTSTRASLIHTFSDVIFSIFDADIMLDLQSEARIQELETLALSHPDVTAVELWNTARGTARIQGYPEANDDSSVRLRGVPIPSVTYQPQIQEGRWLTAEDEYAIVLNQKLAEQIGVGVGDWITISIPGKREADWQVTGLLFEPVDQDSAIVPRPTLMREIRQVGRGTAIRVQIAHDTTDDKAIAAKEEKVVTELRNMYETRGYDIIASAYDTSHRMIDQRVSQMSILIGLLTGMAIMIAVVGAIALSGTLSINVLERTREIGVMRAIGASSLAIAGQFVGEGLILGWLSWLIAIPLSIPVGQFVVGLLSGLMNVALVYQFSVTGVVAWFIIISVLAVVASWFPAQKAAQTSVRESLAYA